MIRFVKGKAVRFVLLFFVCYGVLYGANYVLTGMLIPGGYYVSWMDNYTDYISGMRELLLGTTAVLLDWMDFYTVRDGNILWVKGGHNIRMMYTCLGLNILFMWWAFVVAFPRSFKRKVKWLIGGTILLVGINIARLTVLTAAPDDLFSLIGKVDHHNIFNVVSYGLILMFIKTSIDKSFIKETNVAIAG